MTPFTNALCAVDGTSESLAAVDHAAALVGTEGHITLLVVTAFRNQPGVRTPAIQPGVATEIVAQTLQRAERAGVSASVVVDPEGPPARVILQWAADHDLLAIGVPSTRWFGAMLMGGVAAAAEDSLYTPLLVSHETPQEIAWPARILVASDGRDESDGLVEFAGILARAQGASVTLLHALGAESRLRPHRIQHHRIERQAEGLEQLLGGNSDLRIELGNPRKLVVETAREVDASLIVMSSRRLRGPHAVGSVSRRVVHHAGCAVLLMPPESLASRGSVAPATIAA